LPTTTAPLRGETAALPEGALTMEALAYERRAQPAAALAGAPPPRAPIPAPAHKTGVAVGGVAAGSQAGRSQRQLLMRGLEQSLALTKNAFKKYATKQGREEEALKNSFQEALVEMVVAQAKSQAISAADKIPFVRAIRVSVELSLVFADGVGRALEQVNAELARKYDFSRLGEEVDEETFKLLQAMRGYQAEATRQLPRILAEGLGDVAAKAMEMVLDRLGAMAAASLGKVLDDVAGQIALHLERRFDMIAVFREAVREAGGKIPAGRLEVERRAFNFASSVFIDQLSDKELQGKLKLIQELGGQIPVEGKLLASLIKMLAEGSYAVYTKHVDVPYVQRELKQMLVEGARKLAAGLVGLRLEASQSGDVELAPDRIGVPATWLPSLRESTETSSLRRNEYSARVVQLRDYAGQLITWLEGQRAEYRDQWRPYAGSWDFERYGRIQEKFKRDWYLAFRKFGEAAEDVISDFGEGWDDGTIREHVSEILAGALNRNRDSIPTFTPFS
jgi:hypothetical protein